MMQPNLSHVFEKRILIFIETAPQSNKYKQIIFTAEEFPRITKSIGTPVGMEGDIQVVEIEESNEIYDLPDLRSHL